ncbi:hypothetical protein C5E16_14440 [Clavibacter michiganensis]|uniref:Secreted protein n=1 Tax=Clavibacter michiganensis TaxID=28447 RepID=A0A2S5VMX7_9MICO|nr:hypothetical protein [Clavibacter michiganensis]PPF64402.1 hypothetical protein C5E16_14440 [Clavibacter michiganensis]
MNRSIPALVLAGALALLGTVASPTGVGSASADPAPGVTFYSVPWDDGLLYRETPYDHAPQLQIATYDQWARAGSPAPVRAEVRYLKQPWSPVVFGHAEAEGVAFETELDFAGFARAGYPRTVDRLPAIAIAQVVKYATSDELIVTVGRYNNDEYESHKLTFREWAGYGYPAPLAYFLPFGIQKLSWSPAIAVVDTRDGVVRPNTEEYVLQFGEWQGRGFPTPAVVGAFPGDRFCQTPGDDEIRYVGLAAPDGVGMSFAQWARAGYPRPTAC